MHYGVTPLVSQTFGLIWNLKHHSFLKLCQKVDLIRLTLCLQEIIVNKDQENSDLLLYTKKYLYHIIFWPVSRTERLMSVRKGETF